MHLCKLLAYASTFFAATWIGISTSNAKPMTLQFEAEVGIIHNHDMIDIGFDVMVGDSLSGQFSFEPEKGDGSGTNFVEFEQPFSTSIEINGEVLTTSGFLLTSFNNSIRVCDCGPGTVVDPSGVFDILQVSVDLGQLETTVPNISPERSFWRLTIEGRQSLLLDAVGVARPKTAFEQPELPNDVSTWNALNSRRTLDIYLSNQFGQGVYLQAYVGDFQVIPEPSTCCIAVVFGTICTSLRWRKKPLTFVSVHL